MARIGSFDIELNTNAFFDRDLVVEGWLDDDYIDVIPSAGAVTTHFFTSMGVGT